jgi:exodeoxyribonuclease VII large subunit
MVNSEERDTPSYLSVSELTARFNAVLKEEFPSVAFRGEISECKFAASGHLYFTVKDEKSQLSTVMWKGVVSKLPFRPAQGMEVLCHGKPTIYQGNGRFQVVVHRMEEAGEGALQRKFLELKKKLEKEGLFDEERKRAIPYIPTRIGVVTSRSGAAIHDIMTRVSDRMPIVPVLLYDARVQGEGSAEEIVAGIEYLQKQSGVDVIIIGRGGGSLEDLWAFNEEIVVRAVFASRVPIVSAVGHEVDTSLSDLAADLRAPTPTAAGELVVPRRDELLRELDRYHRSFTSYDQWFYPFAQRVDDAQTHLTRGMHLQLERCRTLLEKQRAQLSTLRPDRYLAQLRGNLHEVEARLRDVARRHVRGVQAQVQEYERRFSKCDPSVQVKQAREQMVYLEQRLRQAVLVTIREKRQELRESYKMLQAFNVDRVLKRGFSFVRVREKVVRSIGDLQRGDEIDIRFAEGEALAEVKQTSCDGKPPKKKVERKKSSPKKVDAERQEQLL